MLAASCRHDGIFIDMEHGAFSIGEHGARFVLTGSDHNYLVTGATQRSEVLRSIVPGK